MEAPALAEVVIFKVSTGSLEEGYVFCISEIYLSCVDKGAWTALFPF